MATKSLLIKLIRQSKK
uniref:Uncharacterized protein n=1 Tax=Lepeophtheirus salmonis TaxID=72036 RepID=A0A0K2T4Q7_LEPSM